MLNEKFKLEDWGNSGNELRIDWSPSNTFEFGPFRLNCVDQVLSLIKNFSNGGIEYDVSCWVCIDTNEVPTWE